jgi:hypothetical protein
VRWRRCSSVRIFAEELRGSGRGAREGYPLFCPAGQKQKTRLSALFSKPIKKLLLFHTSSSKQLCHSSNFQTIFLYHTVLTNHPPTMPKSKRAQRGASSSILFRLFCILFYTSSELRACIHSKVTYVKRSPSADLALKTFTHQS